MTCTPGCCASPAEHYRSLAVRTGPPKCKATVDHTDTAVVTTTEHWHDRQDVAVRMRGPVAMTSSKESSGG